MMSSTKFAGLVIVGMASALSIAAPAAQAQNPIVPIVVETAVDTAIPIVVNAVKPKTPVGLAKFEGYILHANSAQITARAQGNDLSIQTFPLSAEASAKMQTIVEKGGFQYGDKVTIYYDPTSLQARKFRGKPSKSL